MVCTLGKPQPNPARLLAFELVMQVNQEGAYANIRLPELLGNQSSTWQIGHFVPNFPTAPLDYRADMIILQLNF